jgi:hypothetical protein
MAAMARVGMATRPYRRPVPSDMLAA